MIVLVVNCGSSSFKYQLLDMDTGKPLCSGLVERIGESSSPFSHKKYAGSESLSFKKEDSYADHSAAFQAVLAMLTHPEHGSISRVEDIKAIGHRVVHGGELLTRACVVGEEEKEKIRLLVPMAPLHNPACLQGIEVAQTFCSHAPSVAVFDTEFHSTMPPRAFRYGLPQKFYTDFGIRRYGFHGTSHKYVSRKAAEFLRLPPENLNLITCHLGNGCSLTAVQGGKSIDTTMGLTPLPGPLMGTRCGDIDPAIIPFLAAKGYAPAEIDRILNKESGLKGICGLNDLRDVHAAREKGDARAELAFEMLCYSIRRQIGALWACLGRTDALVFTAGIGENDSELRQKCLQGLERWGVSLDQAKNSVRSPEARRISKDDSKVQVLIIPTNEELEIARSALLALEKDGI
ncbi:MAG: acetate kinase [Deltaproteobacteria bacterium]|jgi:acetate kinase|nr:acetate kinase [Deltaproteobacteria bacterium]